MKWCIFVCSLMLAMTLFYGTTFSSDNHIGAIDTFLLKREIAQEGYAKIQRYLNNIKDDFPAKEPIFITMDDTISEIHMPTYVRPFIIVLKNANTIIYENPGIFPVRNIKNNVPFKSENQSNQAVNAKLADRIVPIDHCTYVKENRGGSFDIVSLFFDKKILSQLIKQIQPMPLTIGEKKVSNDTNKEKKISAETKQNRVLDFISSFARGYQKYYGTSSSDEPD